MGAIESAGWRPPLRRGIWPLVQWRDFCWNVKSSRAFGYKSFISGISSSLIVPSIIPHSSLRFLIPTISRCTQNSHIDMHIYVTGIPAISTIERDQLFLIIEHLRIRCKSRRMRLRIERLGWLSISSSLALRYQNCYRSCCRDGARFAVACKLGTFIHEARRTVKRLPWMEQWIILSCSIECNWSIMQQEQRK